ncbi:MAG TPA: cyclic nucleotide-binding and patatin-like phospholipase domain-containing protein [Thermoanaerobaculia bacterium]|nr:cyclic nucleotide-binding and patatin-like phospholipase domain-containing protein [Thermoanaerobaculia bacterium]
MHHEQFVSAASKLFGAADERVLAQLEQLAEWVHVRRAEHLFRAGDPSDGVYVVVSGRLQIVGDRGVIGEATLGETIGEMSFFTSEPRSAAAVAARDSLLIKFPNDAFERVLTAHPAVVRELMRVQIARLRRTTAGALVTPNAIDVAVVGLDDRVPLHELAARLAAATARIGSTLLLDPDEIDRRLGVEGISRVTEEDPQNRPLVAWLNQQEALYRFVIYQTDSAMTEWTERCIRQADRVLLVADAGSDPAPRPIEALLSDPARLGLPRRTLLLLHPNGDCLPAQSARWLAPRQVEEHHHLRWNSDADFDRLARFLGGRAVGLVLGGGGARGFAHIGVIRALRDANVAIDMIGGTSMGGSIAAQWAMGWSPEKMLKENRHVWVELRPQKDYTLPMVSLLADRATTRCGRMMYGETQIEDLWLRFYCVSSDLARAEPVVHRSGSLFTALMATAAVPGVAPPVLSDGRLLVDGAFLNNVPADVIRQLGCGRVIASEVTVETDATFMCNRVPSPWEMLRSRFGGKKERTKFPSMIEILLRASLLASSRRQSDALKMSDLVFHPPIDAFGLMDFDAIDALEQIGYDHARTQIDAWRAAGSL